MQTSVAETWTDAWYAKYVLVYHKNENGTGKSYMNVYGIVMKYDSHFSKWNTPRMDAEATKLYSVMTWGASLGTSWEL